MHSFHVGGIEKKTTLCSTSKKPDDRCPCPSRTIHLHQAGKIWQTLGTLHTCDGNYPPTSPPNFFFYMALFSQLQEPPFVCFRLLRMNGGKIGNVTSPHLPDAVMAWCCGGLMKLVRPVSGSIPSEVAMVRSGEAGICCCFLKKPIDDSSKQMQTTQKKQTSYTSYVPNRSVQTNVSS